MAITSPFEHPLLSPEAADLAAELYTVFEEHVELAENLLGVTGLTNLDADELSIVTRAVVRQINLQIAQAASPAAASVKRERKGDQEIEYATSDSGLSVDAQVDPIALSLVQGLVGAAGWDTVRSFRR